VKRRAVGLVVVLLLTTLFVPGVGAQTTNILEEQIDENQRKIESIEALIAEANVQATVAAQSIAETQARIGGIREALGESEQQLAALEFSIDTAKVAVESATAEVIGQEISLDETRVEIGDTRVTIDEQAVELYMLGGPQIGFVLNFDTVQARAVGEEYANGVLVSLNELLSGLNDLEQQEADLLVSLEERREDLESEKKQLELDQVEAEAAQKLIQDQQARLEAELANQRAVLEGIEHDIEHFAEELDAFAAEEERLQQLLIEAQQVGGDAPSILLFPTQGRITSAFGYRLHPILGYERLHAGVDISAPSGTEIFAAGSGRVIGAGVAGGYGNRVIIDHGGGLATLYAHQSRMVVSEGDQVVAGDLIGYVGSTGLSTGPHLHFETRESGTPVDPLKYIPPGP
jgi:murein DD-endopeptidase MepM/ murein hydrolase activator NlpD